MRSQLLVVLLLCLGSAGAVADTGDASTEPHYTFHEIISHDGVPLNVVEAGNPDGEPVVFLHGFSQSYLSWRAQLDDPDLVRQFRLIALDLRGHGASGKPWLPEAYQGYEPWADDLAMVMQTLDLRQPWLVAWSFGGFVALDYVRRHGQAPLAGLLFTGSHGGLIRRPDGEVPEVSNDLQAVIDGAREFMGLMSVEPLPEDVRVQGEFSHVMLPPYVRRAFVGKNLDNVDLIGELTLPMLLVLGDTDFSLNVEAISEALAHKSNIELRVYAGIGHSPFVEATPRFNADLVELIHSGQAPQP